MGLQLIGAESARAHHPRHLVGVHVHWAAATLEQSRCSVDVVAHEVAADVVGVEVRGEDPCDPHAVGLDQVE